MIQNKIYAQLHKFFQFILLEFSQTGVSAATGHLSNGAARWTSDLDTRSSVFPFNMLHAHICGTKVIYCQISQATSHQGAFSGVIQSVAEKWNETATTLQNQNPEVTRTAQEVQTSLSSGFQSFIDEAQRVSQASVFFLANFIVFNALGWRHFWEPGPLYDYTSHIRTLSAHPLSTTPPPKKKKTTKALHLCH